MRTNGRKTYAEVNPVRSVAPAVRTAILMALGAIFILFLIGYTLGGEI